MATGPAVARAGVSKSFSDDLAAFIQHLRESRALAITRFGDQELRVLKNVATSHSGPNCVYDPARADDRKRRDALVRAYTHCDDNYIVGLSCPCCVGLDSFLWMRRASGQMEAHLTWANLFVNANYSTFMRDAVPLFRKQYRRVVLVCNRNANVEALPFGVDRVVRVGDNAWRDDVDGIVGELLTGGDELASMPNDAVHDRAIVLLCAGFLSNILVHRLWIARPCHAYVNVGSVFDPMFFGRRTRGYHGGNASTASRICVWGDPPRPLETYRNSGWGLSLAAFSHLRALLRLKICNRVTMATAETPHVEERVRVVEFGSGVSTRFLRDELTASGVPYSITSFDDSAQYAFKPAANEAGRVSVQVRPLHECEDEAFEKMFTDRRVDADAMRPRKQAPHTRQHNVFYAIGDGDLPRRDIDLVIVDGPHGNGRSLAFIHVLGRLRAPEAYIFVDDLSHYDFEDRLRATFDDVVCVARHEDRRTENKWRDGGSFGLFRVAVTERR